MTGTGQMKNEKLNNLAINFNFGECEMYSEYISFELGSLSINCVSKYFNNIKNEFNDFENENGFIYF
jgi:hypothetical protein